MTRQQSKSCKAASDERRRLLREISDVYFIRNIRNTALISLSQAHRLVKALRAMDFAPDEVTLSRLIVDEGLRNTQTMRRNILLGIEKTLDEAESEGF